MTHASFDEIVKVQAEKAAYQKDWDRQRATACEFLRRFDSGFDTQLLADEVGMGKTYVAMAVIAAKLLSSPRNDRRALLITPPSAVLRSKWEQEFRSFSQNYLCDGIRALRPLIVRNYWELVANLHDYDNKPIRKIRDENLDCILHSLWQWAVRAKYLTRSMAWFSRLNDFDQNSEAALRFSSTYSLAAWWEFLDEYRARQVDTVSELITALRRSNEGPELGRAYNQVKALFCQFAETQDHYEPNVLILGMSALQTPRSDQIERQRFNTFVLGVLLVGKWEHTRKAFIKALKRTRTILVDAKDSTLAGLAKADLYNTRHCVVTALETDLTLRQKWLAISQERSPEATRVNDFFKELMKAIIRIKLSESGIELAVIDEAHNWKDGKNGGNEFMETFAPAIRQRLLMSATPFQLAEGEMRRVFERATNRTGNTNAVVAGIYDGGVVDLCLAANERFRIAWDRLAQEPESLDLLDERLADIDESPKELLTNLLEDGGISPALKEFCRNALDYRVAIDRLTHSQRQIVIRHVKPRQSRSFHSGSDFALPPGIPRTALYDTSGMTKDSDAFVSFLAMRIDQKVRMESGGLTQANAHLMGGLTSSKAAFVHGASRVAQSKAAPTAHTQDYMSMFNACLGQHEHPKVLATVEHAFYNYVNGRKTLIFCERIDTLAEIDALLKLKLDEAANPTGIDLPAARKALLEDEAFVDLRLASMLCIRHLKGRGPGVRSLLEDSLPKAIEFAVDCLTRTRAKVTDRRVIRLLDLGVLAEIGKRAGLSSAAEQLFLRLRSCAATPGPNDDIWLREAILQMLGEGHATADSVEVLGHVKLAAARFLDSLCLWEGDEELPFAEAVWALIESEAEILLPAGAMRGGDERQVAGGFYATLTGMQTGLRKVLLRPDLFRMYMSRTDVSAPAEKVHAGVRTGRGEGESTWTKMVRFVQNLADANGTINPSSQTDTRRRSLWRGVNLLAGRQNLAAERDSEIETTPDDLAVQTLYGSVKPERRVVLCAAFNSPLAPDILICTAIGSEGIDLHKECAEVIHHDLPWNPARLEQRIGRIDRVGSLAEIEKGLIRVGVPFQEQSYERFQHRVLLTRAQRFEVLLGRPDFDLSSVDEEVASGEDTSVVEIEEAKDATCAEPPPCLPEAMVRWLSIDLSLQAAQQPVFEHTSAI